MLLSFDVVAEARDEHDDWHTHEHLPERLSIPGFLRGTRWIALEGEPRYCVIYEVEQLATLGSSAYLERLNDPSPWTSRIMPSYRGMTRGFCAVAGSFGVGLGHASLLVRLAPAPDRAAALRAHLLDDVLPRLPAMRGLGSAHLLEGAATPAMTKEQSLRGADAPVDRAVLVIGYGRDALAALAREALGTDALMRHGAESVRHATYRMDYALARGDTP